MRPSHSGILASITKDQCERKEPDPDIRTGVAPQKEVERAPFGMFLAKEEQRRHIPIFFCENPNKSKSWMDRGRRPYSPGAAAEEARKQDGRSKDSNECNQIDQAKNGSSSKQTTAPKKKRRRQNKKARNLSLPFLMPLIMNVQNENPKRRPNKKN